MTRISDFLGEMEVMSEGPAAICHWVGLTQLDKELKHCVGRHHFWSWSEGCSWHGIVYQAYSSWVWNDRIPEDQHRDADLSVRPEKVTYAVLSDFMHRVCDIADKHGITLHSSCADWFTRFKDSEVGLQFGGQLDSLGQSEVLRVAYTQRQVVVLLKDLGFWPYCGSKEVSSGKYVDDESKINFGSITYRPGNRVSNGFIGAEDSLFAPGWEACESALEEKR